MTESGSEDVHIEASKLGTKDYWDARYEMELENFKESGDEGEVWFGRSAENRIVKYLLENHAKTAKILDLGCGNGSVLRRLRDKGYTNLTGVDYCPAAIDLARNASKESEAETGVEIQYKVFDILNEQDMASLAGDYDVILDKGTWDAMSLCEGTQRAVRRTAYAEMVKRATSASTQAEFVIVSCNFTCPELRDQFEQYAYLRYKCDIAAVSSFSFGGASGVTSSAAVFHRIL